ncbi:hypothetical protein A9Q99_18735 [Gammaproteobacteria bacterium 45_16_T64]|nr:hypothetical protein A9Q99_18735 [Gammaproteobacteria bacterium 45_16_T64]
MDISHIKQLEFIRHLNEQQIILLYNTSETLKFRAGDKIISAGEQDPYEYYLLAGEIVLKESGDTLNAVKSIHASSHDALKCIIRPKPREFDVYAQTNAALLRVELEHLKSLLKDAPGDNYEVRKVLREDQPEDKQLFFDIYTDLRNNQLTLPSLPDVALRIRQLIAEGSNNAKTIAQAVNSDAAIATKLIKAANSPLFRGTKEFETTNAAIVRLGMQTTQQLVTSFTLREVFKAKVPALKQRMDALWKNGIEVAAISSVLAKHVKGLNPEQGLLAGLLHEIGIVPVLMYAEKYEGIANDPEQLEKAIQELAPEIGGAILNRWGFSDEIVEVTQLSHQWQRNHEGAADYCDLIIVARLHAQLHLSPETASQDNPPPPLEQCPAFLKLCEQNALTPEKSLAILSEAKEQIEETKKLLGT